MQNFASQNSKYIKRKLKPNPWLDRRLYKTENVKLEYNICLVNGLVDRLELMRSEIQTPSVFKFHPRLASTLKMTSWYKTVATAPIITSTSEVIGNKARSIPSCLISHLMSPTQHLHLYFISQNIVTWPCLASRKSGKYNLLVGHPADLNKKQHSVSEVEKENACRGENNTYNGIPKEPKA